MEHLVPEAQIHERLGLRTLTPLVVPGRTAKVNLRRFKLNGTTFLHRGDIVRLLRSESEALGGDPVLDRLADLIKDVTS